MVRQCLLFFIIMLIIISAPFVGAEMITTMKITDYLIFSHLIDDEVDPADDDVTIGLTNLLNSRLDIKSRGNKNVKAQFQLDCNIITDEVVLDVPRAYVKVRLPDFRLTIGKTRVSWGEGFMFNAGDVIFGGMSLNVDITQAVLRDETDLFTVIYIPLGRFSYIETVFLPFPEFDTSISGLVGLPMLKDIGDVSLGTRIATKAAGITFEGGYLYQGLSQLHKPYIAAHGHLFVDWYAAAATAIPHEETGEISIEDGMKENFTISCGFYNIIGLDDDSSLNLRLETGLFPFGEWEEWDPEIEGSPFPLAPYGIFVYPEIVYSPNQTLSFQLRSIVSPVDVSGMVIAGMNWELYQGFSLGCMATVMFGDADDLFGWERDGDAALMINVEYVFGE
jgi:hypothetical protein